MSIRFVKTVAIASATVALLAPFAGQAATQDAAMDTCISTFVASLPKEQPIRVQKQETVSGPLSFYSRGYKILLSAKGMESGRYLARGTCIVDSSGQVIAFNGKPLLQKVAAR